MNDPRFLLRTPAPSGPPVLWVLLGLMAGAHVLRTFFTLPSDVPAGALSMESLLRGEWWSVLTYPFTHRDVLHLVTNLALLALFGHAVERQAGGRHLLYIFIAGAWAGAGLHLMLWPDAPPVIGASGGAYAVIGAFGALFPEYDLLRPLHAETRPVRAEEDIADAALALQRVDEAAHGPHQLAGVGQMLEFCDFALARGQEKAGSGSHCRGDSNKHARCRRAKGPPLHSKHDRVGHRVLL